MCLFNMIKDWIFFSLDSVRKKVFWSFNDIIYIHIELMEYLIKIGEFLFLFILFKRYGVDKALIFFSFFFFFKN